MTFPAPSPFSTQTSSETMLAPVQPRVSVSGPAVTAEGERRDLNSELWHACAGPLVALPTIGSRVVYLPQGHSEQVAASTQREVDAHIPNYPNLPPQLVCRLHDLILHADMETDEVYCQLTLQPINMQEKDSVFVPDIGLQSKQPNIFFCKTLTASDTSTHGGFSIPRRAAEKVFPPLDYSQHPPAQELKARDLHDTEWKFRHIYRGQPKRHLLTTGWSVFVSAKRLIAGDAVLFIRNERGQLLLGIRRANRPPTVMPSSVLSSDSMHIGVLAAAAHAASTNSKFTVFYNPRASPSEFVIPYSKYEKAVYHTRVSVGMRFRMLFETEDLSVRRYMGTITGISDLDPVRWPNSQWRSIKVGWDESTAGEHQKRVSLWEIEPLTTFLLYPPSSSWKLKNPWTQSFSPSLTNDVDYESFKNSSLWTQFQSGNSMFQSLAAPVTEVNSVVDSMHWKSCAASGPDSYDASGATALHGINPVRQLHFQQHSMQADQLQYKPVAQPQQQSQVLFLPQQQQLQLQYQQKLEHQHQQLQPNQQLQQNQQQQQQLQPNQQQQQQLQPNQQQQQQQNQQQQNQQQQQQQHQQHQQQVLQNQQLQNQQQQQQQRLHHREPAEQTAQQQHRQQLAQQAAHQQQQQQPAQQQCQQQPMQQQWQQQLRQQQCQQQTGQQQQQRPVQQQLQQSVQQLYQQPLVQKQQLVQQPLQSLSQTRGVPVVHPPAFPTQQHKNSVSVQHQLQPPLQQTQQCVMQQVQQPAIQEQAQQQQPPLFQPAIQQLKQSGVLQQKLQLPSPIVQTQQQQAFQQLYYPALQQQLTDEQTHLHSSSFSNAITSSSPLMISQPQATLSSSASTPQSALSESSIALNSSAASHNPLALPASTPQSFFSDSNLVINSSSPVHNAFSLQPVVGNITTDANHSVMPTVQSVLYPPVMTSETEPHINPNISTAWLPAMSQLTNPLQQGFTDIAGPVKNAGIVPQIEPVTVPNFPAPALSSTSLSSRDCSQEQEDLYSDIHGQMLFGLNNDYATAVPSSFSAGNRTHNWNKDELQNQYLSPLTQGQTSVMGMDFPLSSDLFNAGGLDDDPFLPQVQPYTQVNPPMRTYTKVYKYGSVGRSLDVTRFNNYDELRCELANLFGLEGQLEDPRSGWQLIFVDKEDDLLLLGDDPWEVFVNNVRSIRILSPTEVSQMQDGIGLQTSFPIQKQQTSSSSEEGTIQQDSRNPSSVITSSCSFEY